jgi:DSF synthase
MGQRIAHDYVINNQSEWQYVVLASSDPTTFNLGGDLSLFVELIEKQDRATLMKYARACIDGAYGFHTHLEQPVTSIALIEGNAQGGGFEAALSCNVIIAERGTHMGFPEVLFNMFPGMGAYSFLSRRVGAGLAERLIYSGDLYSAETLYELGVVDVLAESGAGFEALTHYVRTAQRRSNANRLLQHVRETYNQVPYEELLSITTQWVDSALNLAKSELSIMQRLVRAQNRRAQKLSEVSNLHSLRQAT